MFYDLLFPLTAYHWLVLGLLMLAAEALGASGFLLGSAAAALAVALLMLVTEPGWQVQVGMFAVLAVALSVLYWQKFQRFNRHQDDHQQLNDRAAQLVGRRFTADRAVAHGHGKLRIGDTLWSVTADQAIDASQTVEVVSSNGMTLVVKKVET